MLNHLPLPALLAIFVASGVRIWFAGIQLSTTTDILDDSCTSGTRSARIVLAVATNLLEIAITVTAAAIGQIDVAVAVAVGDILGDIALQTVMIVVLDVFGKRKEGAAPIKAPHRASFGYQQVRPRPAGGAAVTGPTAAATA